MSTATTIFTDRILARAQISPRSTSIENTQCIHLYLPFPTKQRWFYAISVLMEPIARLMHLLFSWNSSVCINTRPLKIECLKCKKNSTFKTQQFIPEGLSARLLVEMVDELSVFNIADFKLIEEPIVFDRIRFQEKHLFSYLKHVINAKKKKEEHWMR